MKSQSELQCVQAFITNQYSKCIDVGLSILSSGATDVIAQLVLISCQRMGETSKAEQLGADAVLATAALPWTQLLLKLTLGQVKLEDALRHAKDEKQRCAAQFYAGARLMTLGMLSGSLLGRESISQDYLCDACTIFDACLATEAHCEEYLLAKAQRSCLQTK